MCDDDDQIVRGPRAHPPILRDPRQFLVLPMPRPMMGTIRVEGTLLRVRACRNCGCNTTIQFCPVCGGVVESSRPPEEEGAGLRPIPRPQPSAAHKKSGK